MARGTKNHFSSIARTFSRVLHHIMQHMSCTTYLKLHTPDSPEGSLFHTSDFASRDRDYTPGYGMKLAFFAMLPF